MMKEGDDLHTALNQVLKLLQADPEYVSELEVTIRFYLGPGLILFGLQRTDEQSARGEEEMITMHAMGPAAIGQQMKHQGR